MPVAVGYERAYSNFWATRLLRSPSRTSLSSQYVAFVCAPFLPMWSHEMTCRQADLCHHSRATYFTSRFLRTRIGRGRVRSRVCIYMIMNGICMRSDVAMKCLADKPRSLASLGVRHHGDLLCWNGKTIGGVSFGRAVEGDTGRQKYVPFLALIC